MATENQKKVSDLAYCLYSFKLSNSAIKGLDIGATGLLKRSQDASVVIGRPNTDQPFVDSGVIEDDVSIIVTRDIANEVLDFSDDVADFVSRAAAAGFVPPSNPMLEIMEFNDTRSISNLPSGKRAIFPYVLDAPLSDDIVFNIGVFLDLLDKEGKGEIDLTENKSASQGSAQLSSYRVGFAGFDMATTGDGSDMLSFLPDADMIKRSRVRRALGSLDFSNREPKVLFTANYDPDGVSRGCILGWLKIQDASGYIIKRYDLFNDEEKVIRISNSSLDANYKSIKNYVNEWALSFYDYDTEKVHAYIDDSIRQDNMYTYKVQAYQSIRTDKDFVFGENQSPVVMSQIQLKDIQAEMNDYAKKMLGKTYPDASADDISPYPFLSKKLYGHDRFDWILAATNVKAAIERGDDRASVRSNSYLGAKLSFITSEINQGKFYKPTDPNDVIVKIKDSIMSYGLTQTLMEIIDLTGLNLFFGQRESPQEDTFKRATSFLSPGELNEIDSILGSIDADTATVDVKILTNNLLSALSIKDANNITDESATPREITIPEIDDVVVADDPLQFVSSFDPGQDVLDLATFEGISEFVRIIRLFFDMAPNRSSFEPTEFTDRPPNPPIQINIGGSIPTEDISISLGSVGAGASSNNNGGTAG